MDGRRRRGGCDREGDRQTDGQLKKCKTGTWDVCVSCMAGRGSAVDVVGGEC